MARPRTKSKDAPDTREPKEAKAPTEYGEAHDAQEIARELIAKYHPHLEGLPIRTIYRSTDVSDKGRPAAACVKKVAGLNAYLAHENTRPFFVIEINEVAWNSTNDKGRHAIIDTQLCKMRKDEKGKLSFAHYDCVGFVAIANRYGATDERSAAFVKAASKQLSLLLNDGEEAA